MQHLNLPQPDDWHLHLRDGPMLAAVAPASAARFARALVMPNLDPPVCTVAEAAAYRERIRTALGPAGDVFEPWMALYLMPGLGAAELARARDSGFVLGVKYYPAGVTTGAAHGVRRAEAIYPVLEAMERLDLPLQVHGEWPDPECDIDAREAVFIERVLEPVLRRFAGLRVVLEHVSTREGVAFVRDGPDRLAATVTVHHLLYNRNSLFAGGRLRPHHYCLPVLKAEPHRQAILEVVAAGHPRFFLGTDSAPHARTAKESAAGCAGVYSAPAALELYAEVFEAAGCLQRLPAFAAHYGADFYRLPRNAGQLTLQREDWQVPECLPGGAGQEVVPLRAGGTCRWRLLESARVKSPLGKRFRGYLPVVVDVETGGFNPQRHALLEIAAVLLRRGEGGALEPGATIHQHLEPFPGAKLDPKSLEFNRIDPEHPFRYAVPERDGLAEVFRAVRAAIRAEGCNRAILVGHNAAFDLSFLHAAARRAEIKRNPFHPFSCFDTVSLGALAYGQTVLARAVQAAGLEWNTAEAHSALYDAERTAALFCTIVNRWEEMAAPVSTAAR